MIVKSIKIERFRAFKDLEFELGPKVTAIAGQNGTMKSTLLGMLAQPFSLTDEDNEMFNERTIDGLKFESKFQDKFKISPSKDVVGEHRYTLAIDERIYSKRDFTCISIERSDRGKKSLRFWSDEGRKEGMGYIQCPILFLSLKRLSPIGEERLKESTEVSLTAEESAYFIEKHNELLCLNDNIQTVDHLLSSNKNTLAPTSDKYDAITISAGQDNIGKILMAILSFKRLKSKCPNTYKGGILFIDEIDATLFPAAQEQLVKFLFHESKKLGLQVVFTTHSLNILNMLLTDPYRHDGRVIYLAKRGEGVVDFPDPEFNDIVNDLNIISDKQSQPSIKMRLYCEDEEALLFTRYLLKKYNKHINFMKGISLGCGNYFDLLNRKIPEFTNSLIVLDSDTREKRSKDIKKYKNVILLPKENKSPEQLFYSFLKNLDDTDDFWDNSLGGYTKQVCFKNYHSEPKDRVAYKSWFNEQKVHWGRSGKKLFDRWARDNVAFIESFLLDFDKAYLFLKKKY